MIFGGVYWPVENSHSQFLEIGWWARLEKGLTSRTEIFGISLYSTAECGNINIVSLYAPISYRTDSGLRLIFLSSTLILSTHTFIHVFSFVILYFAFPGDLQVSFNLVSLRAFRYASWTESLAQASFLAKLFMNNIFGSGYSVATPPVSCSSLHWPCSSDKNWLGRILQVSFVKKSKQWYQSIQRLSISTISKKEKQAILHVLQLNSQKCML